MEEKKCSIQELYTERRAECVAQHVLGEDKEQGAFTYIRWYITVPRICRNRVTLQALSAAWQRAF